MNTTTPVSVPTTQPFLGAFELFKPSITALLLNIRTLAMLIVGPFLPLVTAVPIALIGSATDVALLEVLLFSASALLGIAGMVLLLMIMPALFVVHLRSVSGHIVTPLVAFREGRKHFWRFYGATLLLCLLLTVSFVALIVPYFFAMRRYMLVQYYVIDRNIGVIDAFKRAANDSITYKSPMWGLVGVTVLLNVAGGFPVVSWIIWIPTLLYTLAPAVRYQEMQTANAVAAGVAKPIQ